MNKPLFVYDTCAELKLNTFDLLNEFFWKYIQVKSSHALASVETQAIKGMILNNCPLMYYSLKGDYELIKDTVELADAFTYFLINRKHHTNVKRLGRVAGGLDFRLCLFKEAGLLFLQSRSIDTSDWTQIKLSVSTATFGEVTGNSGTLIQTISTGITEIANTNISAQEHKNQARDIINVEALPEDVKVVYEKVNAWREHITKDNIKKFQNQHTTDPGTGTVHVHNFIEFSLNKKTFTI